MGSKVMVQIAPSERDSSSHRLRGMARTLWEGPWLLFHIVFHTVFHTVFHIVSQEWRAKLVVQASVDISWLSACHFLAGEVCWMASSPWRMRQRAIGSRRQTEAITVWSCSGTKLQNSNSFSMLLIRYIIHIADHYCTEVMQCAVWDKVLKPLHDPDYNLELAWKNGGLSGLFQALPWHRINFWSGRISVHLPEHRLTNRKHWQTGG